MKAKIIKLLIQAHIIIEDGDSVLHETLTKSLPIYRGQEISNEFLCELERITLQEFNAGRLK